MEHEDNFPKTSFICHVNVPSEMFIHVDEIAL